MNDIDKLINIIHNLSPRIPLHIDLWTTREIAFYLKRSESVIRDRIVHIPGFPRPIRIPSSKKGRGHPLWKASEVILWTENKRDK